MLETFIVCGYLCYYFNFTTNILCHVYLQNTLLSLIDGKWIFWQNGGKVRWPRELSALQIKKTISQHNWWVADFTNFEKEKWLQTKRVHHPSVLFSVIQCVTLSGCVLWAFAAGSFFVLVSPCFSVWFCCEYLQDAHSQIDKDVFLVCCCFIYCYVLCEGALSSLGLHRKNFTQCCLFSVSPLSVYST